MTCDYGTDNNPRKLLFDKVFQCRQSKALSLFYCLNDFLSNLVFLLGLNVFLNSLHWFFLYFYKLNFILAIISYWRLNDLSW